MAHPGERVVAETLVSLPRGLTAEAIVTPRNGHHSLSGRIRVPSRTTPEGLAPVR